MRERALRLPRDPLSLSLFLRLSQGRAVRIEGGGSISRGVRSVEARRTGSGSSMADSRDTGTLGRLTTSDTSCLPRLSNWPGWSAFAEISPPRASEEGSAICAGNLRVARSFSRPVSVPRPVDSVASSLFRTWDCLFVDCVLVRWMVDDRWGRVLVAWIWI